jgi:hypothetical protein
MNDLIHIWDSYIPKGLLLEDTHEPEVGAEERRLAQQRKGQHFYFLLKGVWMSLPGEWW